MLTQRADGGDKGRVKASSLRSLEDAEVTGRAGPRPPAPLREGRGPDARPGRSGLTTSREHLGAVGRGASFPALQAPRRPARPGGRRVGRRGGAGQGLRSPSTAAAARCRERRGGPGGPAGPLEGPARPSYTSCRWGALKGFARARCATDENIFLGKEGRKVRGKAKGAVWTTQGTGSLGPRSGPSFSRLRALEEVTAASLKKEAGRAYSQSIIPEELRSPHLPRARPDQTHSSRWRTHRRSAETQRLTEAERPPSP